MAKRVSKIINTSPVEPTVITYDGSVQPLSACRKINTLYYKVGDTRIKDSGQCYLMPDEKYYRVSTGKIAWDNELQQYNYVAVMLYGVIDNKEIGYFSPCLTKNVEILLEDQSTYLWAISESAAVRYNLAYSFAYGKWVQPNNYSVQDRNYPVLPQYTHFAPKIYGLGDHPQYKQLEEVFNAQPKVAHRLDEYIHQYSLGLEIETDGGWFPQHLCYKYGVAPLYDGSIKGSELTTLPNAGSGTISSLINLFQATARYNSATQNNSLHVNVGNLPNSVEFRVALFCLYYRLQQEINAFIPRYKKELDYLTKKKGGAKDHCKDMPALEIVRRYSMDEEVYQDQLARADQLIVDFLHEGKTLASKRRHFREGQPKWEWHSRYYALNFMPLYFGKEEAARVEYRVHSGTVNPTKAVIWTLLCCAITKFAELHAGRILQSREKITLEDVVNEMFDGRTANYINAYIVKRSHDNTTSLIKQADIYGDEFKHDNNFTFIHRDESGLYDILKQ